MLYFFQTYLFILVKKRFVKISHSKLSWRKKRIEIFSNMLTVFLTHYDRETSIVTPSCPSGTFRNIKKPMIHNTQRHSSVWSRRGEVSRIRESLVVIYGITAMQQNTLIVAFYVRIVMLMELGLRTERKRNCTLQSNWCVMCVAQLSKDWNNIG